MNAVLLYLATGHIEFAPLTSLLSMLEEDVSAARRAILDKHALEHPTLPPPVSPKSVYRLAHLLQLAELQQLALDTISSGLTIEGAARELFSPVSIAYAEVKKVILDHVVENWEEVQASESWAEMRGKTVTGEIMGAAQIPFDLLAALFARVSTEAAPKTPT